MTRVSVTQAGMVLLMCLIFLTALTLLGLSASADTVLQNRLASNLHDSAQARQSALSGLAWAEHWLLGLDGPAPETCTETCDGLYLYPPEKLPPHPEFESLAWWIDQGHEPGVDPISHKRTATIGVGSINPPVWISEMVHSIPPEESESGQLQVWYRILVRGSGQTETAVSVIESTVVRSWPPAGNTGSAQPDPSGNCRDSETESKCRRVSWRELR